MGNRLTGDRPRPEPIRWRVGLATTVAVLAALVLLPARAASGHAIVVGVDPPEGAVLARSPEAATVHFTEEVRLVAGGNLVLAADATEVTDVAEVDGEAVRFALPPNLADGTYVVTWHVISVDSHPVRGSSLFHVGAPSTSSSLVPAVGEGQPWGAAPLAAGAQGLLYATLLVSAGAGWFARRWETGVAAPVERVVGRSAVAGLAMVVVVGGLRAVELSGRWGAIVDVRALWSMLAGPVGVSLGLAGVALLAQRAALGRAALRLPVWVVGVSALIGAAAVEGHTRSASPRWVALAADAVHVGAGALWLGGVAALVAARSAPAGEWWRAAVDVSAAAVAAVTAVAVAGVALAATIAPDAGAVAATLWGRAILVKVGAVGVLVVLGWYNRFRIVPRLAGDGPPAVRAGRLLRATLGVEVALFAVVLAATGVAVGSAPVTERDARPPERSLDQSVALSSGVGTVAFALAPVAVGYNDLYLRLTDPEGQPLELVWDPIVELTAPGNNVGPINLEVHDLGGGSYHVPLQVPFGARWEITVRARTGTFESGDAVVAVSIG